MRKFAQSLPMLLLSARESTMEHFRPILKEHALTEQQWRVLRALFELKESNAKTLAKSSFIFSSSLSRILTFFIKHQLIEKRTFADDHRESILTLTPKGVVLFNAVGSKIESKYAEIQQNMCPDKLNNLYELLNELIQANTAKKR